MGEGRLSEPGPAARYRTELAREPAASALRALRQQASRRRLILLTATRDVKRSAAEVLRGLLADKGR